MHRIIIDENGNETKVELTQEEIQAMQEQAAEIVIDDTPPKVTLDDKVDAILKQFNYDRMNGKDLIQELDAIVTTEMKG